MKLTLDLGDQELGDAVSVGRVLVSEDRWLAVHESSEEGRIIGAARVRKGTKESFEIPLLAPTMQGVYFVVIHEDDGDSFFDYQKDAALISDGHVVMTRFVAGYYEE